MLQAAALLVLLCWIEKHIWFILQILEIVAL